MKALATLAVTAEPFMHTNVLASAMTIERRR